MTSSDHAALVRRLVADVWNDGRPETAAELIGPALPGLGATGPEGTLAWHRDRREAFPDLTYQVTSLLVDGDEVAFWWQASGTQRGRFGDLPATGRAVEYHGATFLRIADGRVVALRSVNDLFGLLMQLGAEVTPPVS
jgi:ketosteroid isomerase-like protein